MKTFARLFLVLIITEFVLFTCIGFYDLVLFDLARNSIVTKVATGLEIITPVFCAVIDAWATR